MKCVKTVMRVCDHQNAKEKPTKLKHGVTNIDTISKQEITAANTHYNHGQMKSDTIEIEIRFDVIAPLQMIKVGHGLSGLDWIAIWRFKQADWHDCDCGTAQSAILIPKMSSKDSARNEHYCDVCGLRNGDHRCLECNNRYKTVEELVAHQSTRQHFGGHYIMARAGAGTRRRRAPARMRDNIDDEIEVDEEAGANTLDAPQLDEETSDEVRALLGDDEPAEDADDIDDEASEDNDSPAAVSAATDTPELVSEVQHAAHHISRF